MKSMKTKKSYYLGASLVKKLSGFTYFRLAIYRKRRLIDIVGFLDLTSHILFVDFERVVFYVLKGLDFVRFKGLIGQKFKENDLSGLLLAGIYNWIFRSKINRNLFLPKKFWKIFLNQALKFVYYLVFRNLLQLHDENLLIISEGLSKILMKRSLVIKKLNLLKN